MKLLKKANALCKPAYLYLMISIVIGLFIAGQNLYNGNVKQLCVGSYTCNVSNVLVLFALNALYVLFWTVVLDSLCKNGLKNLSWFLVLFPLVLFAVGLGLLLVNSNTYLA